MFLRPFLVALGLVLVAYPIPALPQSKDARGVVRSQTDQGPISAIELLVNVLQSGRFKFSTGKQRYFDKRITIQDASFVDSTGEVMDITIQSSRLVVTTDDNLRINTCRKGKLSDTVAWDGEADRSSFKRIRHRKGTGCRINFTRNGKSCVGFSIRLRPRSLIEYLSGRQLYAI